MEEDLLKVKTLLKEYINIIIKEYGLYISDDTKNYLLNNDIVKWSYDTISFYVSNGVLYLPFLAYKEFEQFKLLDNYGINKKVYNVNNYLNINTTYLQYINSVIEGGLLPIDYL